MTCRPYGFDRWIGKVTLTPTTRTLVMSEGAGAPFVVNLTAGAYWLYDGTPMGDYPPFFAELLTRIHAANGTNVYGVRPITSPLSPYPWGGLELYRISGTDTFSLRLEDVGWTLDRRILGYDEPDNVRADSDGQSRIQSRRTVWGQWVPSHIAADKRADSTTEGFSAASTARPIGVYVWARDTIRDVEYLRLPAAAVRRSRAAELPEYAARCGKTYGDTHHTWQDLWEQLSAGGVVLIRHNDGHSSFALGGGASWEAVQLAAPEQRASFEATLREASKIGETYDVAPTLYVLSGTYEHT